MVEDFNKDIAINPEELDLEWLRQPQLYAKYAARVANANANAKRADEKVKVVRSELIIEAQEKLQKATAQTIEAYYRTHPRHIEAKQEWLEASYEAEMLQNSMWALNNRKDALENLVKLHMAQYFSGPSMPRDLGARWKEVEQGRDAAFKGAIEARRRSRRTK